MLEALERWEEAEIKEMSETRNNGERKVILKVEYEKPEPNLLKDCHIEGRLWILMWLEEMLECGFEITKEAVKEDIEDLKSDLSDIKRFELIRDEWTRARDEIEEDQKYV
ncbi:hypothetical protein OAI85_00780 [Candidatus Nitrosopelagicus sp.]|nr:hypothetical protein [Candidatus Nitrosopelagicus sp.]